MISDVEQQRKNKKAARRKLLATSDPIYRQKLRDAVAKHQRKKQAYLNELKSKPCMDCGNTFPPECMDFDHVRGTKFKGVGLLVMYKSEVLEAEIAKCDLVCANCHRIRTTERKRARVR